MDPGRTTGVARFHAGRLSTYALPYEAVGGAIREIVEETAVKPVLVYERFVITRRTARLTQQTAALKVSGVLEDIAVTYDLVCSAQNISDAKRIGHPKMLRALGWWSTGALSTHKNDAAAHVLALMAKDYRLALETLVTPDII